MKLTNEAMKWGAVVEIDKKDQRDTAKMNMVQIRRDSRLDGTGGLTDGSSSSPLAPEARDLIGEQLRKHYDSMMNAPIPDRLKDLLTSLAASETKK